MHVAFLGLRGFPEIQGGVETHCEHLCPLLVEGGCRVTVITRGGYQKPEFLGSWQGVNFVALWSPRSKGAEAIVHTLLGVLYAGLWLRPDVLHIHAIGPALLVPLARLLGLKVVVTHHGPDYDRQKWGGLARTILRMGERFGMRLASQRIVISEVIRQIVRSKHARDSVLIPNGVDLPVIPASFGALESFNLVSGKYALLVSRLVPEKRHLDLIEAFGRAGLAGWKLVIVGASDHPDEYTKSVLAEAAKRPDVVCTGFQKGLALQELYAHAGVFVLPSSHEGLPIALLEALSFGLPVIASDIPANLEVALPPEHYYPLGEIGVLADRLKEFSRRSLTDDIRAERRAWVAERYNWRRIAEKTMAVYRDVCAAR